MSEPEKNNDLPASAPLDEYRDRRVGEIQDLIGESSLGTPDALEIRAQTPPEITDEILRKAGVLPPEDHVAPVIDIERPTD